MYKGDGNYRVEGRALETSFLDLLNSEHERVSRLNESYRALDIAKKCRMRTAEYEKDIKVNTEKLEESRKEIREYIENKLNHKASL